MTKILALIIFSAVIGLASSGFAGTYPLVITTVIPSVTLKVGIVAPSFTPVTASGGSGSYSFSFAPSLPAGLSYNVSTGQISGTPAVESSATTYTVSVVNIIGPGVAPAPSTSSKTFVMAVSSYGAIVNAQLAAQIGSLQRFSKGQTDNILSHLQQVHAEFGEDSKSDKLHATVQQRDDSKVEKTKLSTLKDYSIWISGNTNDGSMKTGDQKSKFLSNVISVGLDKRLRDNLIIGIALGSGWDKTRLDNSGSKTTANSPFASIYTSFKAANNIFIDGLAGYGHAQLRSTRWQQDMAVLIDGNRHASSYFSSLIATLSLSEAAFKFEPFIRSDYNSSKFHAYKEEGNTTYNLGYNSMKVASAAFSGGSMASFNIIRLNNEVLTPFTKLQYTRNANLASTQGIYYTDTLDTTYYSKSVNLPKESITGQVGLRYKNDYDLVGELMFGYAKGSSAYISRTFGVSLRLPL